MRSILLIEPDKVLSKTYSKALTTAGFKVIACFDAQQAVNLTDKKLPDLIIVEIQLVSHSGIEFLYELRTYSEWQNIPVIILSVVPSNEFSENWGLISKELNISEYLYKPTTSLDKLTRTINSIIK